MGTLALKKENERLQKEINDLNMKISNLLRQQYDNRSTINDLREEISAEKEKYAALLEKYIAMMEKAAKLDDQTVETVPDDMMAVYILADVEALIYKCQQDNGYNYQLDSGFAKIKEKYLRGRGR